MKNGMYKLSDEKNNDKAAPVERLVMRDLQISDCVYENNFPANIEWSFPVVVQITERGQGVVLYTCKSRGTQQQCFLPLHFSNKYTNDMYIFGA